MHELRVRFVSENADVLSCCPAACTMAGGAVVSLSLVFARCAEQMEAASSFTLRLWVHNESANVNEECIVFSWR